ncbi:hypothetical protein MWH25_01060 [Natroniella acetigena]|uniref:hypothetical protein n=1 Tax=Natroniella acetigena TaxID=52004 RepID=UPI00200A1C7F|nr:hypothetical protein [Natroniella acetigena]MCK8826336.1 hypothetical protein [Natroniella acetigena]
MNNYYERLRNETDLINYLYEYITNTKNMIFSKNDIKNLYFSLKTQRLVVLNSKPGMGKTELCKSYVEAFENLLKPETIKKIFIPIKKDFDRADLLGYQGLDEKYYPSKFARELFELNENGIPEPKDDFKIYFIILDEMNLSQIDFYFSEILASIENNENIELPNGQVVSLPDNTFFLGTINSFTYESSRNPVSGSVKRRANIINVKNPLNEILEIESEDKRYKKFVKWINKIISQSKNKFNINEDFLNHFRHLNFEQSNFNDENFSKPLFNLTTSLNTNKENQLTFGVLQDIIEYIFFSNFDELETLDVQITQKILPQLSGSIKKLEDFESFLDEYSLEKSKKIFSQMKQDATNNMGQIIPLC